MCWKYKWDMASKTTRECMVFNIKNVKQFYKIPQSMQRSLKFEQILSQYTGIMTVLFRHNNDLIPSSISSVVILYYQ